MEQLVEDAPVLTEKYVRDDGRHQLVAAHRRAVRETKEKRWTVED